MSPPEQFFDAAVEYWRTLSSDPDAQYDKEVRGVGGLLPYIQ